jgi:hypothetical protein
MTHAELAELIASMGGEVRSVLDIGALRRKGHSDKAIMRSYLVPPVIDHDNRKEAALAVWAIDDLCNGMTPDEVAFWNGERARH